MQQSRGEIPATSFDEASMERSKNFVKALQELKSLRPQLYSAAEYCEKSYLHSEQKQMVLDNLKDYAVRALVNAVDHLGTVAYKLADLFDQHTVELSNVELRVTCLDQRLHTWKVYTDKEGMRQQELFSTIPRHHKHYILPNSFNRKVHFTPHTQTDARQKLIQAGPRLHPSGTPAANTLSWHLASETNSTLDGNQESFTRTDDPRTLGTSSAAFHLLDAERHAISKTLSPHRQKAPQRLSVPQKESLDVSRPMTPIRSVDRVSRHSIQQRESLEISKPMTPFRSFDKVVVHGKVHAPSRSKSLLSAFFPKQKTRRLVS